MSFYLKLGVAVNDRPGNRVKRGDITHVHAFDVWEERPMPGQKVAKNNLIIFLRLPDIVRNKIQRLRGLYYFAGVWEDQHDVDNIPSTYIAKRRVSIPFTMIQNRFPALWASVTWSRVVDEDDSYQPWLDEYFTLTSDMKDFLWDKYRNNFLTHQEALDELG